MSNANAVDRVVVIGLDGATYDVLEPLMQAGLMPNLARWMAGCAWGDLMSVAPCVTPAAWSSFQTGADPLRHGVVDYRYFDHRQGAVLMNTTSRLRCPTLFECLSAAGGSVVSLGLPMTWPVSPSVSGIVVGGIDSPSGSAAIQPYPEFGKRLAQRGIEISIDSIWHRRPRDYEELVDRTNVTIKSYHDQAQAARIADEMHDWRCLFVQFQALDAIQHRCWHLLGIDAATEAGPHDWTQEVHRSFRALDQAIGELLELASRRGAAVCLLSDHGFGPFREKISIREVLRRRGLLAHATLAQRAEFVLKRSAWKVRRYARKTFYGRATNTMFRSLASLDSIDWRRTRAVALHGTMAGLIYLVDSRRFDRAPTKTPSELNQALADTLGAFREVTHPETGESLFQQVVDVREAVADSPLERCLPDVIAVPADGFHTRVKADRRPKLTPADPDMSGTHRPRGVFMLSAPGIRAGHARPAQLRDVAPTLLSLLGVPGSESMQGRTLSELWAEALPTNDHRLHMHAPVKPQRDMTDDEQALVEQRLRELGYID